MFRTKEEREHQVKAAGEKKIKASWFRSSIHNTTTTITIPTSPGGLLAKQLRSVLASCPAPGACRKKNQEGGGVAVQRQVVKSNPFPRKSCGRSDCLLDLSAKGCREKRFLEGIRYCGTCARCRTQQEHSQRTLPTQARQQGQYSPEQSNTSSATDLTLMGGLQERELDVGAYTVPENHVGGLTDSLT